MSLTPRERCSTHSMMSPRSPRTARGLSSRLRDQALASHQWRFLPCEAIRLHRPKKKESPLLLEYTSVSDREGHSQGEMCFAPYQSLDSSTRVNCGVRPLVLPPSRGPNDDDPTASTDLEVTLMNLRFPRSSGNVSPTRRTGRIVMQEGTNGYLYDENKCWFLPFDSKSEVRGLSTSMQVTYNRCVDEEGRSVGAVRLMKSGMLLGNDELSTLNTPSQKHLSKSCVTFLHSTECGDSVGSHFISPPRKLVRRPASPQQHRCMATPADDEQVPPWGLGYFCTLQRLQNKPVRLIPRRPSGVRRLLEPDEATLARFTEQRNPISSPANGTNPTMKSVFDGHDNRATDEMAAWKDSVLESKTPKYGVHWYIPCRHWQHIHKKCQ